MQGHVRMHLKQQEMLILRKDEETPFQRRTSRALNHVFIMLVCYECYNEKLLEKGF